MTHHQPQPQGNQAWRTIRRFIGRHPWWSVLIMIAIVVAFPTLVTILIDRMIYPAMKVLILIGIIVWGYFWIFRKKRGPLH